MAKGRRKGSTSAEAPAEKPQRTLRFKLPPEQAEALRKFVEAERAPEQAEAWKKFAKAEREHADQAGHEQSTADEARKLIDQHAAIRDGLVAPPWQRAQPARARRLTPLPTTRPKGVGPKVWKVMLAVVALRRRGEKWHDLGHLRGKVHDEIDDSVSKRTLETALGHLRREHHINF